MNLITRFFTRLLGLSALESAIPERIASMLPAAEAAIFKLQIRQARFRRNCGGRSITFSHPSGRPVAPLKERLEVATLAVLTIRGKASGFRTTATVSLKDGILAKLDFDPIPWSNAEAVDIQGHLGDIDPDPPT